MFCLLCVYFILHLQLAKSNSLRQQRNCSNDLGPLLNLVSDQGKKAVLIPEEDQISLEYWYRWPFVKSFILLSLSAFSSRSHQQDTLRPQIH